MSKFAKIWWKIFQAFCLFIISFDPQGSAGPGGGEGVGGGAGGGGDGGGVVIREGEGGASPDILLTYVIFIVYIKYCYSKHIQILRCINIFIQYIYNV